ncbi:Ribonuclease H [Caenorhabditis elegans]|uniref:Ribonuclease H n=1 Tax=Caenorhabditis elegans TaxID=6239 RepID=H2FLL5_CAEEL|nr:Ribonuclease H [Caenorhabditis elegans]CCF23321.1 Ribonuclease H [Caenorhabditis elegans]|eukprot:NP_001251617.1 Uncharacterized protein CELE_H25P06.5 [Caenorhabditis elegans]
MRAHRDALRKKLSKLNNLMKALSGTDWGCSKELLLKTFNAIVKPVATYASPAWAQLVSDSSWNKIETTCSTNQDKIGLISAVEKNWGSNPDKPNQKTLKRSTISDNSCEPVAKKPEFDFKTFMQEKLEEAKKSISVSEDA